MKTNLISNEESNTISTPKILETKEALNEVPHQLHSAQQEINNLRLLNVCLQSTLLRVQTQLIEYLPINTHDEIKRNTTKQKLASLRHSDDQSRRVIQHQQISFSQLFNNVQNLFDIKQQEPIVPKHLSLSKNERQVESLHEMFYELHTIIHTEHNDRISQLYITLAQTSHSVIKAREVLDTTIHAHRMITRRRMKRNIVYTLIIFIFLSILIFILILSIRLH